MNGTERPTDWDATDWKQAHEEVRRLRQRIFRASQTGDHKKVRSLQKLMLRARSNRLISVRRVTQENKGRNTPGVDKILVKTPKSRGLMVDMMNTITPWKAKPTRRVYIPKANGKRRPLGIPTVFDRVLQAMVKNALEPYWEARFEPTSYGFRPGRGCHDAIGQVYLLANGRCTKPWILDADIKGAFDNISHDHLLQTIGGFPAQGLIRQWLKAGYMEMGQYHDTEAGTPQGGVISPLLANIALHGMEDALGIKRGNTEKNLSNAIQLRQNRTGRAIVRYADDFVVFCKTEEDTKEVRDILARWLEDRGLVFAEDKTRITHLRDGFDFLSYNVKHYDTPDRKSGVTLLIRPSKDAVKRRRDGLREIWKQMRGAQPHEICNRFNPIIKGWTMYHRVVVASKTFKGMDDWMYRCQRKHLRSLYAKKSPCSLKWYRQHGYLGKLNPERNDNYVFGDKAKGAYLYKFSWFKIIRHTIVKGTHSPDDPSLKDYWDERRMKGVGRLMNRYRRILAFRQKGLCPVCGESILNGDDYQFASTTEAVHRHHLQPRKDGGRWELDNLRLVHLYCHHKIHADMRKNKQNDRTEPLE